MYSSGNRPWLPGFMADSNHIMNEGDDESDIPSDLYSSNIDEGDDIDSYHGSGDGSGDTLSDLGSSDIDEDDDIDSYHGSEDGSGEGAHAVHQDEQVATQSDDSDNVLATTSQNEQGPAGMFTWNYYEPSTGDEASDDERAGEDPEDERAGEGEGDTHNYPYLNNNVDISTLQDAQGMLKSYVLEKWGLLPNSNAEDEGDKHEDSACPSDCTCARHSPGLTEDGDSDVAHNSHMGTLPEDHDHASAKKEGEKTCVCDDMADYEFFGASVGCNKYTILDLDKWDGSEHKPVHRMGTRAGLFDFQDDYLGIRVQKDTALTSEDLAYFLKGRKWVEPCWTDISIPRQTYAELDKLAFKYGFTTKTFDPPIGWHWVGSLKADGLFAKHQRMVFARGRFVPGAKPSYEIELVAAFYSMAFNKKTGGHILAEADLMWEGKLQPYLQVRNWELVEWYFPNMAFKLAVQFVCYLLGLPTMIPHDEVS